MVAGPCFVSVFLVLRPRTSSACPVTSFHPVSSGSSARRRLSDFLRTALTAFRHALQTLCWLSLSWACLMLLSWLAWGLGSGWEERRAQVPFPVMPCPGRVPAVASLLLSRVTTGSGHARQRSPSTHPVAAGGLCSPPVPLTRFALVYFHFHLVLCALFSLRRPVRHMGYFIRMLLSKGLGIFLLCVVDF